MWFHLAASLSPRPTIEVSAVASKARFIEKAAHFSSLDALHFGSLLSSSNAIFFHPSNARYDNISCDPIWKEQNQVYLLRELIREYPLSSFLCRTYVRIGMYVDEINAQARSVKNRLYRVNVKTSKWARKPLKFVLLNSYL